MKLETQMIETLEALNEDEPQVKALRTLYLKNMAKHVAENLAKVNGTTSAPEVMDKLIEMIGEDSLKGVSRRFIGTIFRHMGKGGWERIGYETGKYGAAVAIWRKVT